MQAQDIPSLLAVRDALASVVGSLRTIDFDYCGAHRDYYVITTTRRIRALDEGMCGHALDRPKKGPLYPRESLCDPPDMSTTEEAAECERRVERLAAQCGLCWEPDGEAENEHEWPTHRVVAPAVGAERWPWAEMLVGAAFAVDCRDMWVARRAASSATKHHNPKRFAAERRGLELYIVRTK